MGERVRKRGKIDRSANREEVRKKYSRYETSVCDSCGSLETQLHQLLCRQRGISTLLESGQGLVPRLRKEGENETATRLTEVFRSASYSSQTIFYCDGNNGFDERQY